MYTYVYAYTHVVSSLSSYILRISLSFLAENNLPGYIRAQRLSLPSGTVIPCCNPHGAFNIRKKKLKAEVEPPFLERDVPSQKLTGFKESILKLTGEFSSSLLLSLSFRSPPLFTWHPHGTLQALYLEVRPRFENVWR